MSGRIGRRLRLRRRRAATVMRSAPVPVSFPLAPAKGSEPPPFAPEPPEPPAASRPRASQLFVKVPDVVESDIGDIVRGRDTPDPSSVLRVLLSPEKESSVLQAHRRDLQLFADWLGAATLADAVAVLCSPFYYESQAAAQHWLDYLVPLERYGSRQRRAWTLRCVLRAAGQFGYHNSFRFSLKKDPAPLPQLKAPPTEAVRALLEVADERDGAIAWLMATCGVRGAELHRLDVEDYNRETHDLVVFELKSHVPSKVRLTLPSDAAEAMHRWLDKSGRSTGPLFYTKQGNRCSTSMLAGVFKQLSKKSGHSVLGRNLRHYAITTALREGFDWPSVMAFARHRSPVGLPTYDDRASTGVGTRTAQPDEVAEAVATRIRIGKNEIDPSGVPGYLGAAEHARLSVQSIAIFAWSRAVQRLRDAGIKVPQPRREPIETVGEEQKDA